MNNFNTGIRPAIDEYLKKKSEEERDYGEYWSASTAGYCMRRQVFERLKVPAVKDDARKTRVFEVGHIFHEWMQRITKNAGLSIAQELELQDEDLMVRGHIDDLIWIRGNRVSIPQLKGTGFYTPMDIAPGEVSEDYLILYDYKTQNSRAFSYQKDKPMSHYHKMQVGTYKYMIRKLAKEISQMVGRPELKSLIANLEESRILKISKDDLRMSEQQLMWSPELEKEVFGYWSTLGGYWKARTIPKCTCPDHEGGFMAREAYNPFFYNGEPCSIEYAKNHVDLDEWSE